MADTAFTVEIIGLQLPKDVRAHLEKELRSLVLREIARLDVAGDLKVDLLASSAAGGTALGGPGDPAGVRISKG